MKLHMCQHGPLCQRADLTSDTRNNILLTTWLCSETTLSRNWQPTICQVHRTHMSIKSSLKPVCRKHRLTQLDSSTRTLLA